MTDTNIIERVAQALVNEQRMRLGLSPLEKISDLPAHHYRDELRQARVAIAALAPPPPGKEE